MLNFKIKYLYVIIMINFVCSIFAMEKYIVCLQDNVQLYKENNINLPAEKFLKQGDFLPLLNEKDDFCEITINWNLSKAKYKKELRFWIKKNNKYLKILSNWEKALILSNKLLGTEDELKEIFSNLHGYWSLDTTVLKDYSRGDLIEINKNNFSIDFIYVKWTLSSRQ